MNVKDERLAVRVSRDQLEMIREAASAQGRTISDFVTSAITVCAQDVLLEQRVFRLTGARWTELMALLEQPPTVRPRLADALRVHQKRVES